MSKYWAIFRTQVQNRLAYAGDLLSQSGSIIVYLWIFVQQIGRAHV